MKKRILITALALTLSAGVLAACDSAAEQSGAPLDGTLLDSALPVQDAGETAGYRLTFDSCGGTPVDAVVYPAHGYLAEPAQPTREGYRFDGWYWDAEYTREFIFATNTMPSCDVTVYAKWTKQYTVTFDSRGGSDVAPVTGEAGDPVAAPDAPVRAGYVFDGWFADAEGTTPYEFGVIPAQDVTVYALWHEIGTDIALTLMPNTPVETSAQSVTATADECGPIQTDADETFAAALEAALGAPVFTFGGWSYDAAGRQPVGETLGSVGGSATLYAQWTRSAAYASLTFVNGGETLTLYVAKQGTLSSAQVSQVRSFFGGSVSALYTGGGEAFELTDSVEQDLVLTPETSQNFVFTAQKGGYALTDYTGSAADVVIPAVYRSLPVVAVGEDAFAGSSVRTVSVPASVACIGAGAFEGCAQLTAVTGAQGVSSIGENAFAGCTALQLTDEDGFVYLNDTCRTLLSYTGGANVTVPARVAALADDVFRGAGIRTVAFARGSAIRAIPAYAFAGCTQLTGIDVSALPVASVGERAFEGCTQLSSVALSARTASVGAYAFAGCEKLTSIAMDGVTSLGEGAFEGCGFTSVDLRNLVPSGYFANDTFALPARAFADCGSLTSVVLPESLSSVGAEAFAGCAKLETVTVNADASSSLRSVAADAFTGCTQLKTVILFARVSGEQTAEIAPQTFADCAEGLVVYVASGSPAYDRSSRFYSAEQDAMMSYAEIYAAQLGVEVRAAESVMPEIAMPSLTCLLHLSDVSEETDVIALLRSLGLTVTDNASAAEEIVLSVDSVSRTDLLTEDGENTPVEGEDGVYDLSETGRYLVYVRATDRFGNSRTEQVTLVVIE